MPVRVQHIPLEEKSVRVALLSPVVVSDLFECFADFAAKTDVARVAGSARKLQSSFSRSR